MKQSWREIVILVLAILVTFFATMLFRDGKIISLQTDKIILMQNEMTDLNQLVVNTRTALLNSNLSPDMRDGFNKLGWNLTESKTEK